MRLVRYSQAIIYAVQGLETMIVGWDLGCFLETKTVRYQSLKHIAKSWNPLRQVNIAKLHNADFIYFSDVQPTFYNAFSAKCDFSYNASYATLHAFNAKCSRLFFHFTFVLNIFRCGQAVKMTLRIKQSRLTLAVAAQFSFYVCMMRESRIELSAFCAFICLQIKFLDIRELFKKWFYFPNSHMLQGLFLCEMRHIYF